ncbi:MAG: thioredoxin domain-containing protein [Deltaproteobacteria bacterium]|nr:thioredoxin domain-containing protein [Deltaproteobacteria bacterium]
MRRRLLLILTVFLTGMMFLEVQGFAQEDRMVQVAIETIRTQGRVPREIEIKFMEKWESAIPDFFAVKLLLSAPDREIPVVVYVDKTLEKVIIGNLFIKGENITRKEAGEPKPRKIDVEQLEIEKSPSQGPAGAKVTIVEFSNFECPYCRGSWMKIKELLGKHPQDLRYVFKHFPLQPQGRPFDLAALISAVQEVNNEAFWLVHDFMFSEEGQTFVKKEKEVVKQKIEQILQEKGYDVKIFQDSWETGKGKKRVEEDIAVGRKIRVRGTPTTILNGNFIIAPLTDKVLEGYLGK